MNKIQQLIAHWVLKARPVYNLTHNKIAKPIVFDNSIVFLDAGELVRVDLDGKIIWRCSHESVFWGEPQLSKDNHIVCAGSNNTINFINQLGEISKTIDLPTSITTKILIGKNNELWFGMGGAKSYIVYIDPSGYILYQESFSRDFGIRHSPLKTKDRDLWVASDDGVFRIDAYLGKILSSVNNLSCLSPLLYVNENILVVAIFPDRSQAVVQISPTGKILKKYNIELSLFESILMRANSEEIWLIGTTVSSWDLATQSDRILLGKLNLNGQPKDFKKIPAYRDISAILDPNGTLWIGTYTDEEEGETGELFAYDDNMRQNFNWKFNNVVGISTPVFISDVEGILSTSQAIIRFSLEPSQKK